MEHLPGILELLGRYGLEWNKSTTRLLRHADDRFDMDELRRDGTFDVYQGLQNKPAFEKQEQFVVFVGTGKTNARFVGVYHKTGKTVSSSVECPDEQAWREVQEGAAFFYELEKDPRFAELEDRVIVDFEPGQQWVRLPDEKQIVEILPRHRLGIPFVGLLDFTLSYRELKQIVDYPEAHRDWEARLSAVSAIYLIQDTSDGRLYVGSAGGRQGLWGRWQAYAKDGHGSNHVLRDLVGDKATPCPESFRFSILQVLPSAASRGDVSRWETIYKAKLGSREHGLNLN